MHSKRYLMQQEMWLDRVTLSPEFFGLLKRWEELARICLDVLTSLRSPKAQAIYTYIPSRAVHHTESEPFSIKLATILEQIGAPVPAAKSKRKQVFTQNKTSILSQLNGAKIIDGILRTELLETRDGADFKLIFWVEKGSATQDNRSTQKIQDVGGLDKRRTLSGFFSGAPEEGQGARILPP